VDSRALDPVHDRPAEARTVLPQQLDPSVQGIRLPLAQG
jgi:hypothetical protein